MTTLTWCRWHRALTPHHRGRCLECLVTTEGDGAEAEPRTEQADEAE